jgi:hypothetical protein
MVDAHEFSAAFACAVTVAASDESCWLAKNGEESIYAVLGRLFPEVELGVVNSVPEILSET